MCSYPWEVTRQNGVDAVMFDHLNDLGIDSLRSLAGVDRIVACDQDNEG